MMNRNRWSQVIMLLALATPNLQGGDLTPPGSPAPTVGPEARIPIFSEDLPLTINTRGASHYLAETIMFTATDEIAITVTERFVTIDLNGFALIGPGAIGGPNSIGIRGFSAAREVTIRDGTISGFGSDGILLGARGGVAEDLHVFDCGDDGIDLQGENGRVANCTVQSCDDVGIALADGGSVRDSISRGNGTGIETEANCLIRGCVASSNVGNGIVANGTCSIVDSSVSENGDHGIDLLSDGTVRGCTASGNTGSGIRLFGSGALVESCLTENNTGSGVFANISAIVRHCSSNSNGSDGIRGVDGVFIDSCMANNNTSNGISIDRNCTVINCMARFNGNGGDGAGIDANQNSNRIEGNHVIGNDRGIESANAIGNIVVRNLASGLNQDDYGSVADGNALGPVQTNLTGDPGPWDNFAR